MKKEIEWDFWAGVAYHTIRWTFKYLWKFFWVGLAAIVFLATILGLSVNKAKQDQAQ